MQHEGLKLRRDGRVVTLWNMDISSAIEEVNLYGSHPFYLQINEGEQGGKGLQQRLGR